MPRPNGKYHHLVNIFMAVADYCDGNMAADPEVKKAYAEAMKTPAIRKLYGDLVDANEGRL